VFFKQPFFTMFFFVLQKASISKPLCCALRDQMEKSISKSTPVCSDQGQGLLNLMNCRIVVEISPFYCSVIEKFYISSVCSYSL